MLFYTGTFLQFYFVIFTLYLLLSKHRHARLALLLVGSYYFYASWNLKYLALILFSTLVDYSVGLLMNRATNRSTRKLLLACSVIVNLSILGVFKYYNFFVESAVEALAFLGIEGSFKTLSYLLPVGISFYTFQTMSYTIDLYRRKIPVCSNLLEFSVFVAFFPQLVAGPIVRASSLLPQLKVLPKISLTQFNSGVVLFCIGVAKKLLLADNIGRFVVDPAMSAPSYFGAWDVLFSVYGFAFQIYFDFSGYSDMAIGIAKTMGIEIPVNFRNPYQAVNIRDFWKRWHISLSEWLRDYLYIPLGGSRSKTNLKIYRNILITMVLGGLWHGANMTFVAWGAFHGLIIVLSHIRSRTNRPEPTSGLFRVSKILLTFHLVCVSWIFFRADSLGDAIIIFIRIFSLPFEAFRIDSLTSVLLLLSVLIVWFQSTKRVTTITKNLPLQTSAFGTVGVIAAVLLVLILGQTFMPFIYFQF